MKGREEATNWAAFAFNYTDRCSTDRLKVFVACRQRSLCRCYVKKTVQFVAIEISVGKVDLPIDIGRHRLDFPEPCIRLDEYHRVALW